MITHVAAPAAQEDAHPIERAGPDKPAFARLKALLEERKAP